MATEIESRVGLKAGMAKAEGANVQKALGLLGFDNIETVKSVKCYRVVVDGNAEDALAQAEKMCQRLLANPVVHEYSISVTN